MSKSAQKNLLRIAVSGLLFAVVAWNTDWQHVADAFARLRTRYWLAACVLLAVTQVVSALRWQLMAHALGLPGRLGQMTGFYFIGMFFNLVLPTSVGGDVVRAWYLQGRTGQRLASFVSVLMDRLNGLLVLLLMASTAALVAPLDLPVWIRLFVWSATAAGFAGVLLLPWLARLGPRGHLRKQQMQSMLGHLCSPRLAVTASLLSLIVQVANVTLVWLVGQALRAPIPDAFYWILVPMVSILTLVPISVNGLGVREGATALLLAPLGVANATAVTLAFLWFAVHLTVGLGGGLVYLFGNFPKPQPTSEALTDQGDATHGPVDRDSDQGRARQLGQAA